MPDYRRYRVPGGCYFLTINLADRSSDLLTRHIDGLRDAIRKIRAARPFHIDAWVVLPDHMHCLWTLPEGDADYSTRVRLLKTWFTKPLVLAWRKSGRVVDPGRPVWQHRYWEHTIRDDRDYAAHIDYVHFNPVRHGLAVAAAEWPFSTFRHCVSRGLYPTDWATPTNEPMATGERQP